MSNSICKYTNPQAARKSQRLAVLGASGSVGQTTLSFVKSQAELQVVAISVHTSVDFIRHYVNSENSNKENAAHNGNSMLMHVAVSSPARQSELQQLRSDFPYIRFYCGKQGLLELLIQAREEGVDTAVIAIVGAAGIEATLLAIRLGMKVALANKEALVTAGPSIQSALRKSLTKPIAEQAVLLPVDSEHSSVFRLSHNLHPSNQLHKVILTASGGGLRDLSLQQLLSVTKKEVLNHPTWSMGSKITVDSAGLINKGLEVIEAHYLFALAYERLDVWIHRESLTHAIIELSDGSYLLHASAADMVFPIAYALFFPEALPKSHPQASLPLAWPSLDFVRPDKERFPGFYLCLDTARVGGTAPAIFNAANEVAVDAFLKEQIQFTQIPNIIQAVLEAAQFEHGEELALFLQADAWSRQKARAYCKQA